MAASRTSSTVLTTPGIAASGHCIQHWLQPVHFSAMKSGTSKRMLVMSRTELVAAGIALIAANGSAITSLPVVAQYAHTCSQNRPGLPTPGWASGTSSAWGITGMTWAPGSS